MNRILIGLAGALLGAAMMTSCASKDPDLDPEATGPQSNSRQLPWNTPIPGQGGGPLGNLPNQQRR